MFVPDRVGDVEYPEVEEDVVLFAVWRVRREWGGEGQQKLACSLQGQGSTSTGGILAGFTTPCSAHGVVPV